MSGSTNFLISIHALLAESDLLYAMGYHRHRNFYPRSPCGERPTPRGCPASSPRPYFYPRSPCGERRPGLSTPLLGRRYFYPRSPCGERPYGRINDISRLIFLSTLSLRRATISADEISSNLTISIHALLAESDQRSWPLPPKTRYFYPRSPCGERLHGCYSLRYSA